ncbi:MAG: hypothetical protein J3K34DRAFT_453047 [Monoraphidium minutum]|nr:MAG: hypothetical protein J3K34DRAFT_453047 [Monoraphidium minutum]
MAAADAAPPAAPGGAGRHDSAEDLERAMLLGDHRRSSRSIAGIGTGREAFTSIVHSWFSRKFATGCAILLPLVVTFYVTYHFLELFDGFFSPMYKHFFGIETFGLGFITSVVFITTTGVFFSSWLGEWFLGFGEWFIRRVPLVKHLYGAAKQVSAALNPDSGGGGGTKAFQECVLIRHPRQGEYAIAFITGRTTLQTHEGALRLNSVYVPTNHVYVGDIYLLEDKDCLRTSMSVREGLETVVSVGTALPSALRAIEPRV